MGQIKRHNNWQELLDSELKKIVTILKQNYKPEKIIIFGSTFSRKTKEWSDLDLVIIKKTNKRFYDRISEISNLITHNVPLDILIYTPDEFSRMAKDNYFIRDEVLKKGKVIYES